MSTAPENATWDQVLENLRGRISEQKFLTWFRPIRPLVVEPGQIQLEVPNPFFIDWFEEHNLPILKTAVEDVLDACPNIQFTVAEEFSGGTTRPSTVPAPRVEPAKVGVRIEPKARDLNLRFTFENFVVGRGNEFAYAACKAVAADPARAYNPLFIHGGTGLGKTHLMQAIGHDLARNVPSTKICYVSAEKFMNEMIESIQRGSTLVFREKYRGLDLLLIDDIQFMSGKESTQEEFFHTFNTLYDANKQVVVTSDRAPKDIQDLEERLISRFNWGLVSDIQPPDLETRIAIIRHKAERDGVEIPDRVIFRMAEMIRSNIRELEGSIIRIQALAELTKSPITMDLMRDALADFVRSEESKPLEVLQIQKVVAGYFDIPVESIRGKRRTAQIALARQVAMFLTKELTGLTVVEIGRRFGNRDHSTVLHACNKIRRQRDEDIDFRKLVQRIHDSLSSDQRRSDGA